MLKEILKLTRTVFLYHISSLKGLLLYSQWFLKIFSP